MTATGGTVPPKTETPNLGAREIRFGEADCWSSRRNYLDWTTVQSWDDTDGMHRLTLSPRIRASAYYESTVAAGLTDISVYNKMAMPTSYGDLKAEYDRLIEGVAIWDVSVQRQVEIFGPDAQIAAQYFTARDISKQAVGQGKYLSLIHI